MERQNRTRSIKIVKNQLLGEGLYSKLRVQITLNDAVPEKCHTIFLSAWDKVEQKG